MIPEFRPDGSLSPGIHPATWQEFSDRFGFNLRRQWLLAGLKSALLELRQAGCRMAYIDGSFVTDKEFPDDYDGCWDMRGVDIEALDPTLYDITQGRKAQKDKYFGELFPMSWIADIEGRTFMEFFQTDRYESPKGLVALELEEIE